MISFYVCLNAQTTLPFQLRDQNDATNRRNEIEILKHLNGYDGVMQNMIILMTWLTCSKPLNFHVPSLQNITAAKLILISRWGVD